MHLTCQPKILKTLFSKCWLPVAQSTLTTVEQATAVNAYLYHSNISNLHIGIQKQYYTGTGNQSLFSPDSRKLIETEDVNFYMKSKKLAVVETFQLWNTKANSYSYIDIKLFLLQNLDIDGKTLAILAKDCAEVYHLNVDDIETWIQFLLKYSFTRNQIKSLIEKYPWLLLVPVPKIAKLFHDIVSKIEITRLELPVLCVNAPCVLVEDSQITLDKYHYLHFIMSFRDIPEIVKSGVLSFSLPHIKLRHQFLHRRGQYFQLSRHGSSRKPNPSVYDMFCTTDEKFCHSVANSELDEYECFRTIFSMEQKWENRAFDKESELIKEQIAINDEVSDDLEDDYSDSEQNTFANELLTHL